jgi:DNA-binding transcriptional ArsR family regulator
MSNRSMNAAAGTRLARPWSRSLTVSVEARPAYELLMSLVAVADPGEEAGYEIGADWFDGARAAAGPELIAAIEQLTAACPWLFGNVLGLAIETPEPRDGAALVRHLDTLPDRDIHLALLGYTLRPFRRATPPEVIAAAAEGDRRARREFLATSFPDHPSWPGALRRLLDLGPAEVARLLRWIVREWQARVFSAAGPALMSVAERDAGGLRQMLATAAPSEVIDRATRGWDYVAEPGITHVILAPSTILRPWVVTADHGDTRIFCCSVADESLAGAAGDDPPAFLVRRLRALADERRLRLLRRLNVERATLHELATEFEQPKTTLHHHLAVLRAAGLIHLRDDASRQYTPYPRYTVRAEAIPGTWEALMAYLDLEPESRKEKSR